MKKENTTTRIFRFLKMVEEYPAKERNVEQIYGTRQRPNGLHSNNYMKQYTCVKITNKYIVKSKYSQPYELWVCISVNAYTYLLYMYIIYIYILGRPRTWNQLSIDQLVVPFVLQILSFAVPKSVIETSCDHQTWGYIYIYIHTHIHL